MKALLARLRAWLFWPVDPIAVEWRDYLVAGIEAERVARAIAPYREDCITGCPQFASFDLIVGPVCSYHERVARCDPHRFHDLIHGKVCR